MGATFTAPTRYGLWQLDVARITNDITGRRDVTRIANDGMAFGYRSLRFRWHDDARAVEVIP